MKKSVEEIFKEFNKYLEEANNISSHLHEIIILLKKIEEPYIRDALLFYIFQRILDELGIKIDEKVFTLEYIKHLYLSGYEEMQKALMGWLEWRMKPR